MRKTFLWALTVLTAGLACLALAVAVAAYTRSHEVHVIRAGITADYMALSKVMGGGFVLFLAATIFGLFTALRQKTPPKLDPHF